MQHIQHALEGTITMLDMAANIQTWISFDFPNCIKHFMHKKWQEECSVKLNSCAVVMILLWLKWKWCRSHRNRYLLRLARQFYREHQRQSPCLQWIFNANKCENENKHIICVWSGKHWKTSSKKEIAMEWITAANDIWDFSNICTYVGFVCACVCVCIFIALDGEVQSKQIVITAIETWFLSSHFATAKSCSDPIFEALNEHEHWTHAWQQNITYRR